jgi:HNH endonuclease
MICIGIAYVWLKGSRPYLRIGSTTIIVAIAYLTSIFAMPKDYGFDVPQQKTISFLILSLALLTLFYKSSKKIRSYFAASTKNEALRRQRQRCGICGKGLAKFNIDFDHKNGDRSNNRLSNCRALCTPCHRKKHSEM